MQFEHIAIYFLLCVQSTTDFCVQATTNNPKSAFYTGVIRFIRTIFIWQCFRFKFLGVFLESEIQIF